MNKILSILIIEDEEEVCDRYVDCIKPLEYFNIVSITNDSAKGIELTTSRKPDIVILDLELQRGSGSGLSYMAWYRDCYIENKPIVVITTHNPSEQFIKQFEIWVLILYLLNLQIITAKHLLLNN